MIIKNYNPDTIAADFRELKAEVEDLNIAYKEKFDRHVVRWIVVDIITSILIAICWLLREATDTLTCTIIAIVATVLGIVVLGFSVSYIVHGPEHVSLSKRMTFAMQFWNIVHKVNLLSIKIDPDVPQHIKIEYELDNNIVRTKRLHINEYVKNTNIKEKYLDVEKGYIVTPYVPEDKPRFE